MTLIAAGLYNLEFPLPLDPMKTSIINYEAAVQHGYRGKHFNVVVSIN